MKQIQVLQNKAARAICHAPPRACRIELFKKLDWFTVNQMVSYHDLVNVFKISRSGQPEYLAEKLTRRNRFDSIILPNVRLEIARKSFYFRAAVTWNRLPQSVRNSTSLSEFKRLSRSWIRENVPGFPDS